MVKVKTEYEIYIFRDVRKIQKLEYQLRHVCPSVSPHEKKTRLQVDGFS